MTLSTWQLIVVGSLAAIWAVVLGVPLLADLLRWLRNRPPSPQRHVRPDRRSAAELLARAWRARPRPLASWRRQEVARRRLQLLMACGMATVAAMFLAIAFRGIFVSLFVLMVAASLMTLAAGALVGAREHRASRGPQVRQVNDHLGDAAVGDGDRGPRVDLGNAVGEAPRPTIDLTIDGVPTANPWQTVDGEYTIPTIAEIAEAFETPDRDGFMFEPLHLDEALSGDRPGVVVPEVDIDVPVDPELAAELGLDLDAVDQPRFEAAPEVGPRQASARARRHKRRNARPIYIESVLDEHDDQGRAIND